MSISPFPLNSLHSMLCFVYLESMRVLGPHIFLPPHTIKNKQTTNKQPCEVELCEQTFLPLI